MHEEYENVEGDLSFNCAATKVKKEKSKKKITVVLRLRKLLNKGAAILMSFLELHSSKNHSHICNN